MGRHSLATDATDAAHNNHGDHDENVAAHLAAHGIGADGTPTPRSRERIRWRPIHYVCAALLIVFAVVTIGGAVAAWPGKTPIVVTGGLKTNTKLSHDIVDGTVALVTTGACSGPSVGKIFTSTPVDPIDKSRATCGQAIVDLTSKGYEHKRTLLLVGHAPGDPKLAVGDKIRLAKTTRTDGSAGLTFFDYQRSASVIAWLVVVALAVIAMGSWRGLRSLIGIAVTLAVVGFYLIPGLLRGGDPLVLATTCGAATLFLALYLVHGLSWKTSSALLGTLIALFLSAGLAKLAIATTTIRGLGSEDNLLIQLYLPHVKVTGLMLAGFIVGSLGVLNDVTISQASTVNELAGLSSHSPIRLFVSAIRVGRDHIASIMYTLVLGYTGAALPLLILLAAAGRPLGQVITSDIMATEIIRSAVGALALTLAVPITTMIAALTVGKRES